MLIFRKLFVALIAAAVTGVTGSPAELEKRDHTIVFCTDAGLGGPSCLQDTWPLGQCRNLEFTTLDKAISAFDPNGFVCTLYELISCLPGGDTYTAYTRIDDLTSVNFNDEMSSYMCN